jgi:fumarate reductase flavoprotein subunit
MELMSQGLVEADRSYNLTWHDWLNLDSLLAVSDAIAVASFAREDSRGAHYREDYPQAGALETTAYTQVRLCGEKLVTAMVPVEFSIVKPGESLIDEEAGAPPTTA